MKNDNLVKSYEVSIIRMQGELDSLRERVEYLTETLEYARHEMWEYGSSEDVLQPVRVAISSVRDHT